MNERIYQDLREIVWRRKLTEAEESQLREWLNTHPESRADWEAESGLNQLLARWPDSPVPSNFTARVLEAVERDESARVRERFKGPWIWRVFVPRFATAVAVGSLGLLAYQRHVHVQRMELAHSVATLTEIGSVPSPQFLEDFEAIQRLLPTPQADNELLALMQ